MRDPGVGDGVGVQVPGDPDVAGEDRPPPRHHQRRQDRHEQRGEDARPPKGLFRMG